MFPHSKPRILYGASYDNRIDFDKANSLDSSKFSSRAKSGSPSGKRAVQSFYQKHKIEMLLDFTDAQKIINEIAQFYEYVKNGADFVFYRNRELAKYHSFGGTLQSNDDLSVDSGGFSRTNSADSAYYLDTFAGYYDPFKILGGYYKLADGANIGRFPAGKFGRGLLIEGARTNLITKPSEFEPASSSWVASNMSVAEAAIVANILGASPYHVLTGTGASPSLTYATGAPVAANPAVFSLHVLSLDGTVEVTIKLSASNVATQSFEISAAEGWRKIYVYHTGAATGTWDAIIEVANGDLIAVDGGQIEAGAGCQFPSSPIGLASTSSISRNADKMRIYGATSEMQYQGCVMFYVTPEWGTDHPNVCLFESGDDTQPHVEYVITSAGNHRVRMYDYDGNLASEIDTNAAGDFTENEPTHIAVCWNAKLVGTETYILALYVDGVLKMIDDIPSEFVPYPVGDGYNNIGSKKDGTLPAFATFSDVAQFYRPLTAGEIAYIYHLQAALGIEKNYYQSLELMIPEFNPKIIRGTNYYTWLLQALEVL